MSKENIIETKNWALIGELSMIEIYQWVHQTESPIEMKRFIVDGFTLIYAKQNARKSKLFEGYIESIDDLQQVTRLCRLHES